eukprot:gnl/TRDRNA2_/TRDRNA2_59552_c0_seq1.p1 gnl/TRDRNA2_/TRDRNA2_59552_c0~~gnl/TRDRNA2_/TRDRNA2_59552_c0_seq1.p1  ORF type:complete len:358 (-),score=42.83 gnl/TRDRNA2_/TRDRNA2_59552_c0_seq1:238-1155(-)
MAGAAWNALTNPKRRMRSKTRRCLVAIIRLIHGSHILEKRQTLAQSGLRQNDKVLVAQEAAPCQVIKSENPSELANRFREWLRLFSNERNLGAIGSQRLETIANDVDDEDWDVFRCLQIQTGAALPPVDHNNLLNKVVKNALEPTRAQALERTWSDLRKCIFEGQPPPTGTSILAAYEYTDTGRFDGDSLWAVVRSPSGTCALRCGGMDGEVLSGSVCWGLTAEHVHYVADELAMKPMRLTEPFVRGISSAMSLLSKPRGKKRSKAVATEIAKRRRVTHGQIWKEEIELDLASEDETQEDDEEEG